MLHRVASILVLLPLLLRAQETNAVLNPSAPASTAEESFAQGEEELRLRQIPQAIASFNDAIRQRPDWEEAYMRRANAKERQNNIYGALQDFTHAATLNPQDVHAHERRGRMLEISGDFAKAEKEYTAALQIQPQWAELSFRRGVTHMILGEWDAATSDLQNFGVLAPQMGNANYAHLYIWYIGHEQGKGADADQTLAAYFGTPERAGSWTALIADFFLGHATQDQLLGQADAANGSSYEHHLHCEAWFYIGLKALVAKDQKEAAADFQKCVAVGQYHLAEHEFAAAKLRQWEQMSN